MDKLSRTSKDVLADFEDAAKSWGWTEDQGCGPSVDRKEQYFRKCRQQLVDRLLWLERKVRRLKGKLEDVQSQNALRNHHSAKPQNRRTQVISSEPAEGGFGFHAW